MKKYIILCVLASLLAAQVLSKSLNDDLTNKMTDLDQNPDTTPRLAHQSHMVNFKPAIHREKALRRRARYHAKVRAEQKRYALMKARSLASRIALIKEYNSI